MKKLILFSFIAISILSCKKDNAENAKQTKTTTEQISFYKDLLINEVTKD